jgi:chitinase
LRELLPTHVISHAPQAPYFAGNHYKNGGYQTVHAKVGNLIDFYNIQFYNQEATTYDTY